MSKRIRKISDAVDVSFCEGCNKSIYLMNKLPYTTPPQSVWFLEYDNEFGYATYCGDGIHGIRHKPINPLARLIKEVMTDADA